MAIELVPGHTEPDASKWHYDTSDYVKMVKDAKLAIQQSENHEQDANAKSLTARQQNAKCLARMAFLIKGMTASELVGFGLKHFELSTEQRTPVLPLIRYMLNIEDKDAQNDAAKSKVKLHSRAVKRLIHKLPDMLTMTLDTIEQVVVDAGGVTPLSQEAPKLEADVPIDPSILQRTGYYLLTDEKIQEMREELGQSYFRSHYLRAARSADEYVVELDTPATLVRQIVAAEIADPESDSAQVREKLNAQFAITPVPKRSDDHLSSEDAKKFKAKVSKVKSDQPKVPKPKRITEKQIRKAEKAVEEAKKAQGLLLDAKNQKENDRFEEYKKTQEIWDGIANGTKKTRAMSKVPKAAK